MRCIFVVLALLGVLVKGALHVVLCRCPYIRCRQRESTGGTAAAGVLLAGLRPWHAYVCVIQAVCMRSIRFMRPQSGPGDARRSS